MFFTNEEVSLFESGRNGGNVHGVALGLLNFNRGRHGLAGRMDDRRFVNGQGVEVRSLSATLAIEEEQNEPARSLRQIALFRARDGPSHRTSSAYTWK